MGLGQAVAFVMSAERVYAYRCMMDWAGQVGIWIRRAFMSRIVAAGNSSSRRVMSVSKILARCVCLPYRVNGCDGNMICRGLPIGIFISIHWWLLSDTKESSFWPIALRTVHGSVWDKLWTFFNTNISYAFGDNRGENRFVGINGSFAVNGFRNVVKI